MEEEPWRASQPPMQERVDEIILAQPKNCLEQIVKMICGKLIGSFVMLNAKQNNVIAVCKGPGLADINISQIMNSFEVFSYEITVDRLVFGRVELACFARRSLLHLHIRFCYNMAVMLLVRSEKLLCDITFMKGHLRSRRRYDQLLNLDFSDEDESWPPLFCIDEQVPSEPLERIADQDPGLYLLDMLERSGASSQHLLPDVEPIRPVEIVEAPNFGMPAEILWNTDAIINWLPEDLRPASLFQQEQGRPDEIEQVDVGRRRQPQLQPQPEPPRPRPLPRPRPRSRPAQAADDTLNRVSRLNHLDQFLKIVVRKRNRQRHLEYKNHLKMLQDMLGDTNEEPEDTPADKLPCPFSLEEIQDLIAKLNRNRTARRSELIADQHLLGVSDITLASNQSVGVANLPPTPVVEGAEEQQLLTPVVAPQPDMEATFIEHVLPPTDVEMLPFMRDEPQQVGDTPQEVPPTNQPESATRADVTMREGQDNVERMKPNVFQEPENAAVTVSVTVGDISFVHALPTHELMEAEAVVQPPADSIATRLRPRRRRRLVFEDSPFSPDEPPRRRKKQKKRRQSRKDAPADGPLDAPHPPADAPHPPADAPFDVPHPPADAHFDDLGVMPLPEFDQQDGEPLFHTLEDRKDKIIAELRQLQMKHGNLISFVQICPIEMTRRDRAAGVFAILLELCYERQIELFQEVPNAPDQLFIKMRFGEQV